MPSESIIDDKTLFNRVAEGDEAAFTLLYVKYSRQLGPYISRLLHAEPWAEEIIQDVFLKLWKVRDTLPEVDFPSAFIYKMAANRTINYLNKRAAEIKLQYRISIRASAAGSNLTEQQFDLRISETHYREAVKLLPAQRRQAYQLKYEEGLSYDEIASRLGISKNTVRNQIVAASQAVRAYMIEKGGLLPLILICGNRFF